MIVYPIPGHDTDAGMAAVHETGVEIGRVECARYRNGELYVLVSPSPEGHDCMVVGSTAPPDARLWELVLTAHTLTKEGAGTVTALLPYMGYGRHDKDVPGDSMAIAAVGACLRSVGIGRILTVDIHSVRDSALLGIPVDSISPVPSFAEVLRRDGWGDATIVAPDNGAVPRCEALRSALDVRAPIVTIEKRREGGSVVRSGDMQGEVSERVVVVDDIIDTGETLVTACETLRDAGVREIAISVTHGVFTGDLWARLPALGVRKLYCSDTIPRHEDIPQDWVETVPVSALIAVSLREGNKGAT